MKEKGQETPPVVWFKVGTACHNNKQKSPEKRVNLPLVETAKPNKP